MKRVYIALFILFATLASCVVCNASLNKRYDRLKNQINLCARAAQENEVETAKKYAREIDRLKQDNETFAALFISRTHLEDIDESISEIKRAADEGDMNELRECCLSAVYETEYLRRMGAPELKNIF